MNGRPTTFLAAVVIVVAVATVVGAVLWARTSAPCGLYKYADAGKVPARCLMR